MPRCSPSACAICSNATRRSRSWRAGQTGVALITLRPNVWYDGPVALLDELYVRPELRGNGIGTQLIRRACDVVRERGARLFEVNVDEGDTGARRFYERHGFTTTPGGQADRMLYYEREL